MTPSKFRFPDFVCVGAQKAGTTWLHFILARHPDIWEPQVKELQYFNQVHIPSHRSWIPRHRDEHARRSLLALALRWQNKEKIDWRSVEELTLIAKAEVSDEWYGAIFAYAGETQAAGEFTPEYALLPDAGIHHLFNLNPAVRIIFLARDPIDRAWSHMRMLLKSHPGKLAEAELVAMAKLPDVLGRSRYPETLMRWSSVVPENQLLVLNYDEIGSNPASVLSKVCGFLRVRDTAVPASLLAQRIHEGEELALPALVYDALKRELAPVYRNPGPKLAAAFAPWTARHFG